MCVCVCRSRSMGGGGWQLGGVMGRVLIYAIFIPLRKIKTANLRFFSSEFQISLIFIGSETEFSAKTEQIEKDVRK